MCKSTVYILHLLRQTIRPILFNVVSIFLKIGCFMLTWSDANNLKRNIVNLLQLEMKHMYFYNTKKPRKLQHECKKGIIIRTQSFMIYVLVQRIIKQHVVGLIRSKLWHIYIPFECLACKRLTRHNGPRNTCADFCLKLFR